MVRSTALVLFVALRVFAAEPTHKTIAYGPDAAGQSMDLYRPASGAHLPVLVFFHGGVWQHGDKSEYDNIGQAFASRGVLTAVVNYRLTPKVHHPAHIKDAALAVAWVVKHAALEGGDPGQVVLSGHSAGGHLVTLLVFDPSYLKAVGVSPSAIAGVVPMSAIFDLNKPVDDTPEGGFVRFIDPPFGTDLKVRSSASPLPKVARTKIPFLVLVAGDDSKAMVEQSRVFAHVAEKAGVKVKTVFAPGRGHFELVSEMGTPKDFATDQVMEFVQAFAPPVTGKP